jgi:hypothetical protein
LIKKAREINKYDRKEEARQVQRREEEKKQNESTLEREFGRGGTPVYEQKVL